MVGHLIADQIWYYQYNYQLIKYLRCRHLQGTNQMYQKMSSYDIPNLYHALHWWTYYLWAAPHSLVMISKSNRETKNYDSIKTRTKISLIVNFHSKQVKLRTYQITSERRLNIRKRLYMKKSNHRIRYANIR